MLQRRLPVPLVRVGYRVAYRVAQVAWYVVRPDVHGVKGILRDGDRVPPVRHTYGDRGRWDVPGGHAHARSSRPSTRCAVRCTRSSGWCSTGITSARSPPAPDHKGKRALLRRRPRPAAPARGSPAARSPRRSGSTLYALPAPIAELSVRTLALISSERRVQRHAGDERELAALALEHVVPEVVGAGLNSSSASGCADDDPALVLQLALELTRSPARVSGVDPAAPRLAPARSGSASARTKPMSPMTTCAAAPGSANSASTTTARGCTGPPWCTSSVGTGERLELRGRRRRRWCRSAG